MKLGTIFIKVAVIISTVFLAFSADASQPMSGHVPAAVTRLHLRPLDRLPATNRLQLAIGLPLRNRDALTNLLHDLYDPASPNYHHFLTSQQFAEQFGPTKEDYQAVMAFATAHGFEITGTHSNRCLLDVRASAADVETAFHLHLNRYRHPTESRAFFAPDAEPTLDLSVPVLHIAGLDNLVTPRPPHSLRATPAKTFSSVTNTTTAAVLATGVPAVSYTGSGPGGAFLGNDFRAAYAPGVTLTGSGQTVALLGLSGFYTNDIATYESYAGITNIPVTPVLVDGYDGSGDTNGYSLEVSLDIEMTISMAPGLAQVLVYEGPSVSPIDDILNRIATDNAARQISVSLLYDIDPATDQIFQQFAAQGQTCFHASGDGDAWLGPINWTVAEDPNITLVGGTTLTTTGPGGNYVSETAWNLGEDLNDTFNLDGYVGTSGGISTRIAIPAWQQGVNMSANHGSTTMRNGPDVALTADNVFVVYYNGSQSSAGGTSAASPLWAGFTALVNQQAAAAGRPPVGFLNPAVYALGQSLNYQTFFNDTVTGDNTWDRSPTNYYAVPGYDLCTGWGTPTGSNLISALAVPDFLQIVPYAGFNSSGGVGGPFTIVSQNVNLSNTGSNALDWAVSAPAPWLQVAAAGGTIPGGTNVSVAVSLTPAAYSLPLGSYTNILWFTNLDSAAVVGLPYTLSILAPPAITIQPTNLALPLGAPANFSVTATGAPPLTYQWYANGAPLSDGLNFSGSATSSLTVSNLTVAATGSYFVTISNSVLVVTSQVAAVSIIPSALVIIQQPAGFVAPQGGTAWFSVIPEGDTPSFQWSCNGTNLPGATDATLVLTNVQPAQAGNYAVTLSNIHGSILSSNAAFTVLSGAPQVATFDDLPNNSTFPPVTNGYDGLSWSNFNAVAGITYPYSGYAADMVSAPNVALNDFANPASITNTTPFSLLSASLAAAWMDGLQLEVKGYAGGQLLYDNIYTLSSTQRTNVIFNYLGVTEVDFNSYGGVQHASYASTGEHFALDNLAFVAATGNSFSGAPAIYNSGPQNLFLAQGQSARLTASVVGQPPITYSWMLNGQTIPGQTGPILYLSNVQPASSGTYAVSAHNNSGSITNAVAELTVSAAVAPLIVTQPVSQFDSLGSSATFKVSALGFSPLSYQWQFGGANIPGATNTTYAVSRVTAANSGYYSVIVTNLYGCATSSVAVLGSPTWLQPAFLANASPPVLFFPSGGVNNGFPFNYQLQSTTDPSSSNWVTVATTANTWTGLSLTNGPATAFFRLSINVPAVTKTAAGGNHQLFLKSDGSLWAAGNNSTGQLGDGTTTSHYVPEMIVPGNVTAIAAGDGHSLFLKADGTLWGMGANGLGQLGDGGMGNRWSPEIIASNVTAIAAERYSSRFIKTDGSLWAMGFLPVDSLQYPQTTPIEVASNNVAAMAVGYNHTLILKRDGSLWVTGWNNDGQFGDGTQYGSTSVPELVVSNDVTAIAAGDFHSLFLKSDGSLWAMGYNANGQLGDGSLQLTNRPEQIVSNGVTAIAAGHNHSLFLKSDGSLWGMGLNASGELGLGFFSASQNIPTLIIYSNTTATTGGNNFTLFLKSDGTLWGMGDNTYGELGIGSVTTNSPNGLDGPVPVAVNTPPPLGIGTWSNQPVVLYSAAASQSPSLLMTTDLVAGLWTPCTGGTTFTGFQITNYTPSIFYRIVATAIASSTRMAAGVGHTLFLKSDGSLWGTGRNLEGQLGDGTFNSPDIPEEVIPGNVTSVAAGDYHSLYLKADGSVWAMGYDLYGQLGDGGTTPEQHPEEIISNNVITIAAGGNHSLFIKSDGSLWGVGRNLEGQLGDGTYNNAPLPEEIVSNNVVAVAAGGYHTVFLKSDGSLWTMGLNQYGALGDGTGATANHPEEIVSNSVIAIAAGYYQSFFLKSDGTLWGMGRNWEGELGDGTYNQSVLAPEQIMPGNVAQVIAGGYHTLVIKGDGSLWATGFNGNGQLGTGNQNNLNVFTEIVPNNVIGGAGGNSHSLFLKSDGTASAMGWNNYGQLGIGNTTDTSTPTPVMTGPIINP